LIILTFSLFAGMISAEKPKTEKGNVYSTWKGLELDKCASAWLIKRFIDKKAVFKFFPRGTFIKEGIQFDTPYSELRRDARTPTFGKIMEKYKIEDPVLVDIGRIVWDVEVNKWDRKITDESSGLNAVIQGLIMITEDEKNCLEKCYIVFDALYAYLKSQRQEVHKGK